MSASPQNSLAQPLERQVAVVTGGSGGIGRAIAERLAAAGAAVILHAHRNPDRAQQVADSIQAAGGAALVLVADLSQDEERSALIARCWEWRNGVQIWVNNAGYDVLTGDAVRASFAEKLERLWQVDVQATIMLGAAWASGCAAAGRGCIVNVGWDQADTGMEGDSGEMFAATKGAVMAFTRSLAKSLAPQVRVNCVAPGWISTDWGDQAPEYWQTRARREALLDRWGTPADVAEAVAFLCSPAAAFITGHVLPVNGGLSGYAAHVDDERHPAAITRQAASSGE